MLRKRRLRIEQAPEAQPQAVRLQQGPSVGAPGVLETRGAHNKVVAAGVRRGRVVRVV